MIKSNLEGLRFGRWIVLREGPSHHQPSGRTRVMWECLCDCGTTRLVDANNLSSGTSKSCGCLGSRQGMHFVKHGHATKKNKSKAYRSYSYMIQRCGNPSNKEYARYGGRGIQVCEEWANSFNRFIEDMGNPPGPEYSIDRIDPNGDYGPSNCRWADHKTQANNRTNSVDVTYNGITKTLAQWSDDLKIKYGTLYKRVVLLKWLPMEAFSTPAGGKRLS